LDDVAFTIRPNEFVGLLGPSGAGKSTLMDALNGMRRATTGKVLINDLDLYQHLDVLKQSIGYVPQDDIIHRELTVYRTLYYVAKLRLAADVTADEIDQIVNEVMDVTGLSERRDVPVAQLSGGQRKRVSIAVELITKPSVIFLDEPTSGLDPATEDRIMRLFRQIAESGRTIVLTTHAMENVSLFDRIAVLMRGKLVFYGAPHEALGHFGAGSFKELYDKLEAPIEERVARLGPAALASSRYRVQREVIAEEVAEEWKRKFMRTEQFRRDVAEPVGDRGRGASVEAPTRERQRLSGAIRQWMTLSRRYAECLKRDRLTLLILLAQAPMISLLTLVVTGSKQPRDFPYFILAIVAIWFGTSVSSREIIRERGVYERERMVNLGLLPYVGSKVVTLSVIVGAQCVLLFGTLKLVDIVDTRTGAIGFSMPGVALGIPQFLVMALTGMVGVAVGLLISSVVRTSEMATSLVPLVLIPQIVFSGLIGVPTGAARVIGLAMPATWAFDEMKQLSGLGVLRDDRDGGLYREIERLNGSSMAVTREGLAKFGREKNRDLQSYESSMRDYLRGAPQGGATAPIPKAPQMTGLPSVPDPVRVPDDLSTYVDFKHPWMSSYLNPVVLTFMFFGLVLATLLALRFQDVK
jgi:ABC-type multidrug transport system ATPase subunit